MMNCDAEIADNLHSQNFHQQTKAVAIPPNNKDKQKTEQKHESAHVVDNISDTLHILYAHTHIYTRVANKPELIARDWKQTSKFQRDATSV